MNQVWLISSAHLKDCRLEAFHGHIQLGGLAPPATGTGVGHMPTAAIPGLCAA